MKYEMDIEGAIFDLDGTLLDSMQMWRTLGVRYLTAKGVQDTSSITDEIRFLDLIPATEFIAEKYLPSHTCERIYMEIKAMLDDFYETKVQMKEGAMEFLSYLKNKGVKMSVATATDRDFFMPALDRLGALDFFEGFITNIEVGRGKHFPDIYDAAWALLGTPKEKTYVFEDIFVGADTARRAGYKVVGVFESVQSTQERENLICVSDIYVDRLDLLLH